MHSFVVLGEINFSREDLWRNIYFSLQFFFLKVPQVYPRFQFILIRRDTCVSLPSLYSTVLFFFPISFQQIYPVLAVFVSLSPRLHDVKPSGSAGSLLSICAKKSRGPAWHGDATRQNGRSSRARHNKSFTMKNHLEEMGRNFCSLRFINSDMDNWTDKNVGHRYQGARINISTRHSFSNYLNILAHYDGLFVIYFDFFAIFCFKKLSNKIIEILRLTF